MLFWSFLKSIPLPILKVLASIGSKLHYTFDKRHVRECEEMVSLVNSNWDSRKVVKGMYSSLWKLLPEIVWSHTATESMLREKIDGIDELKQYYKEHLDGKAVIFVSAHLGPWEITSTTVSTFLTPVLSVYKPSKIKILTDLMIAMRTHKNQTVVDKEGSMLTLFKHLKRKGAIGLVIDQHGGEDGVDSEFLNKKCKSWDSTVLLADRCQCPVIPVATIRLKNKYQLLWEKAIFPEYDEQKKLLIHETTLKIDRALSSFVEKAPEQWLWLGRRWGRNFKDLINQ